MNKTSCDLRVLLRFNDGTVGIYAVDDIPNAERMREELEDAGQIFSDCEVGADCLFEAEYPASVTQVFKDTHSLRTRTEAVTP